MGSEAAGTSDRRHVEEITAAVVEQAGGPFEIEQLLLDSELAPDEVLVKIAATGMCASDLHVRDQHLPVPLPAVLGHEGAGVVSRVGDGVRSVVPGDHVVLSFQSCGHCPQCLRGMPAYCSRLVELNFSGARGDGTTALHRRSAACEEVHGHFFGQSSFATWSVATERNVVKIDPELPFELAAPLGCGLQTGAGAVMNTLAVKVGESIAVLGSGSVGLAAIMAAHVSGANPIIAVDVKKSRLELAVELGATHTVDALREDVGARIWEITGGGADYVLEVTGRPELLQLAVGALALLGTAVQIGGVPAGAVASIDVNALRVGGRSVRGTNQGDSVPQRFIPKLVEMYRAGIFPIDRLVRVYDFAEINHAAADSSSGEVVKPVLRMPA
ncbi:MAG: Alcohol dehydrogenase, zinc-binding domain protein [Acidimicrobiaceae bacterium]|nr:Alcohol dehydrogenase, zinc-binding domain protein [Acidimicrobiaceae bacterium]